MHSGNTKFGLTPIMTWVLAARQMSLRTTQFPLPPAVVSRRGNFTAIGTDKIVRRLQNCIQSHNFFFSNRNFRRWNFKLCNQGYKPAPNCGAFERRTFCGQVDRLRLAQFNLANPGDIEIAIRNFDSLRYAKRLASRFLLLKFGELRAAFEEFHIGSLKVCQSLLLHLRVEI